MTQLYSYPKRRNFWLEIAIITGLWFLLLGLAPLGWGIDWPVQFWIRQGIFAVVLTVAYFTNSMILVPRFLLSNKLLYYGLLLVGLVITILIGIRASEHALNLPRIMHELFRPDEPFVPKDWFRFDFSGMLMTLLAFGVSTSIALVRKGQKDAFERQELEKEKVSTELSFLKAQINPHFFFNTLNNIYALTTVNVESAREAIHKLSSMMRYVLYDAQKEVTMVSQEVKFVENYIELMRLRLPEKVKVIFEKPENGSNELIAPMLLLPYIENAFKHGVSSQTESTITIKIKLEHRVLTMAVLNSIFKTNTLKLEGSGIGLANTRRRLELLYPNKHTVDIREEENQYSVNFQIDLTL